jgi:sigma-B regulation protein RsbU (phosphoserine phosphatase)
MDRLDDDAVLEGFQAALLHDDPAELYDRAPCGYLSLSPDGVIAAANQTFLTMAGRARDEVVGRVRFAELLTGGGRIYHETHFAPLLEMQGEVREIAFELVRPDGARVPVLVNAVVDRDEDGRPAVVRTAVFDARERRSYERELLRAKESAEAAEQRAAALARTLQQTLMPLAPPAIPGLDVGAAYRPSGHGDEVGGDFYDVFPVGPTDWAVVIGDVSGKGVEAAVVTALARYTLRAASVLAPAPSEALGTLNQVLAADEVDRFCTAALLRLRPADGGWEGLLACGGHPLPLRRDRDGKVEPVGEAGALLGLLPVADMADVRLVLSPGDALVFFTDGVTEGRRGVEFYGDDRVAERVASLGGGGSSAAQALADALVADVVAFQGGEARDDIAVVVVAVPG